MRNSENFEVADLMAWTPQQHIERACALTAITDSYYGPDGKYRGSGYFTATPPSLTVASLHLQIAEMKMKGGV